MSNGKRAIIFRLNDHGQGPEIVRQVFLERGWVEYDEDTQHESDWNIWWRTSRFRISDYENIFPWQRLNHYPKSTGITKKDCLVRNLKRMRGVHGAGVFNFSPISFNLPNDYTRYVAEYGKLKTKTDPKYFAWICKPADMSRGRGIFLFRDISELQYDCNAVVQQYIATPLLIGGYKFDIRIYVAVPSFHPLAVYVFQEGLVRFSTEKFDLSSLNNVFSHLTNTSINKHSPSYTTDKERIGPGCKWTITQLRYYLHQNNYDDGLLWARVINIVILTLLIQAPQVPKEKNCYELYGFDILVDENLKPWLLEVNFSPALNSDCQSDVMVKKPLLHDLMDMMNFKDSDLERGGLDKRQNAGNDTARTGRMASGRRGKGEPFDRTMSASRLSQRGGMQRNNSTISSMLKNIEPPVIEQTLSFIQQDNPAIQKQEEKLCFGLPLIHPSDDEKNDSDEDCDSGRLSQRSEVNDPELLFQFSNRSGRYNSTSTTLTSFDKVSSFERSSLSSAVKKNESVQLLNQKSDKTSLQSYGNSDSAYSSFSDNSEKVTVTSTNGRSKIYGNRRKTYALHTEVLSETPRESGAFQIKSLRPTENSKSIRKLANRVTTPVQPASSRLGYNPRGADRGVTRSVSRSVSRSFDRAPSRTVGQRSQSRFGNYTTRSDIDFNQKNRSQGVASSMSSVSKLKDKELIDLGLKGTTKKASPTPKTKLRSRSISVHNKPKGPPPIVGNFFLVFPFNEGTLKASNTTLDPHFVIKETQKLVKDLRAEIDKNTDSEKKLGGLLPYGAPTSAEKLWAPVKPPPEEEL